MDISTAFLSQMVKDAFKSRAAMRKPPSSRPLEIRRRRAGVLEAMTN
jgi:hypothetical protein